MTLDESGHLARAGAGRHDNLDRAVGKDTRTNPAGAPAVAALLTRAFPALGPAARARYQEFVESFAPLLAGGRELAGTGAELPREVEMLAVGAAEAIVFEEVEAGRAAQLPGLGPAILFSVLVPFLGPEAASAEMQRAT